MTLPGQSLPTFEPVEPTWTPAEHQRRAERMRNRRVTGLEIAPRDDGTGTARAAGRIDLGFLEHYPGLESLYLRLPERSVLDPVAALAGSLTLLIVHGTPKSLEPLAALTRLRDLSLASLSRPDLGVLGSLGRLEQLHIQFGSLDDLGPLADAPRLQALTLLRVKGLYDLTPVSSLTALQYLHLDGLKPIAALPDLRRLSRLRRVHLETMNGLTDLAGLAAAPHLEDLILIECPKLTPEAFAPLHPHPTLRRLLPGIGPVGSKKVRAVESLFPDRLMDGFYGTENAIFTLKMAQAEPSSS